MVAALNLLEVTNLTQVEFVKLVIPLILKRDTRKDARERLVDALCQGVALEVLRDEHADDPVGLTCQGPYRTTASSKYAYLVSPAGVIIDVCEHIRK